MMYRNSVYIALAGSVIAALALCCVANPSSDDLIVPAHSFSAPFSAGRLGIRWWEYGGSAMIFPNYIRLTDNIPDQSGYIWNRNPVNSRKWEAEVQFQITNPKSVGGDGLALWYTKDKGIPGPVFGSRNNWVGLGVFIDTYDNDGRGDNPHISVIMNDGTKIYRPDTDGTDLEVGGCKAFVRRTTRPSSLLVRYDQDSKNLEVEFSSDAGNWMRCVSTQVDLPSGYYLGLSAATGAVSDIHDIFKFTTRKLDSQTAEEPQQPQQPQQPPKQPEQPEQPKQPEETRNIPPPPPPPQQQQQQQQQQQEQQKQPQPQQTEQAPPQQQKPANEETEVEKLRKELEELKKALSESKKPAPEEKAPEEQKKEEEKKPVEQPKEQEQKPEPAQEENKPAQQPKEEKKPVEPPKEEAKPPVNEKPTPSAPSPEVEAVKKHLSEIEVRVKETNKKLGGVVTSMLQIAEIGETIETLSRTIPVRTSEQNSDVNIRREIENQLKTVRSNIERTESTTKQTIETRVNSLHNQLSSLTTSFNNAQEMMSKSNGNALLIFFFIVQIAFVATLVYLKKNKEEKKLF